MGAVVPTWGTPPMALWAMMERTLTTKLARFRRLWHRPHVHGDRPVGFDCCFPNSGEDDLPIWSDQIIVPLRNMRSKPFDM
jgi:hypothetical protein